MHREGEGVRLMRPAGCRSERTPVGMRDLMTKRQKRFPASFRFVAVTFALVATASLATTAAADPPSAQEVQDAKDQVAQLAREAHAAQIQLDAINVRANEVAAEYDRELGRLEKLIAPVNGASQGLLTFRQLPHTTSQNIEAALQPGKQFAWRHHFDARCSQLNGER